MQTQPLGKQCIVIGCEMEPAGQRTQFCPVHSGLYRSKYNLYKSLTQRVQKFVDKPQLLEKLSDPEKLMTASYFCYAANLRYEFQQLIKPEHRDEKHTNFIEQLLECYNKLLETTKMEVSGDSDDADEPLPEINNINSCKNLKNTGRYLRRQRKALLVENQRYMDECLELKHKKYMLLGSQISATIKYLNAYTSTDIKTEDHTIFSLLYIPTIIDCVRKINSIKDSLKYRILVLDHSHKPPVGINWFTLLRHIMSGVKEDELPWNKFNAFIKECHLSPSKDLLGRDFLYIMNFIIQHMKETTGMFVCSYSSITDSLFLEPVEDYNSKSQEKMTIGRSHCYEISPRTAKIYREH